MTTSTSTDSPAAYVETLRSDLSDALIDLVAGQKPSVLYDPAEYVLRGGGKRIRPVLFLLVSEALGEEVSDVRPAALALELFHNFTLVHDDVMDQANERRGRDTVHVRWDVGTAILTGDLLMGLSYEQLGQVTGTDHDALYDVYHPMVEQLCAGQALDAAFEAEPDVSVEAYLDMIDGKTGALLATAFELGAVVGGVSAPTQRRLQTAGTLIGRAFQIQDDLLDLTATGEDWGKAIGGDLVAGKKTFLTLRALELAEDREHEWFARIVDDGGLPPEDVPEARRRMQRLGIFEDARDRVFEYTDRARDHLEVLPECRATETLYWLIDEMAARSH